MIIPIDKPTLRRKDMTAVLQTMADEQIGPGEHTQAFIELFQKTVGLSGYALALRDLVQALRIALLSLDLPAGSTIGISALSPVMYSSVIISLGHSVEIFDINPETGNLSYHDVINRASPTLSALILYEPYGNMPDYDVWQECSLPIIEDITESLGSSFEEQSAGNPKNIIICAFEGSGLVSTAGGAALMTQDDELAKKMAFLLEPQLPYTTLPDMNAALGVVQLLQIEKNIQKRKAIFDRYRFSLMKTKHTLFGIKDIDYASNGYGFVALLDAKPTLAQQFCLRHEVDTVLAFSQAVIKDNLDRFDLYPHAIACVTRALRFPLYPFLTNQQIVQIEKVLAHLP
ncbi:MAG: DegT/DnrJ/EryC1/StrS family aminotransferase [Sphaerochaetaceae bacterium]|nr:DegT/DnrJ/EryC1/StrS family aminotransferase [Sphaerochaetaceae bacterium]MDD3365733.1 DegT/DnrJ/EryC1/StrS family aminotransferase [Sphaerochaetaceae bacterium]MDD4219484.1 DegT/DnrJ/EryC1/StrS family aminotransferase [Sphaerochaetaceae bacterium]